MQSELQQSRRMARYAPAEMYKCSEPYETHAAAEGKTRRKGKVAVGIPRVGVGEGELAS